MTLNQWIDRCLAAEETALRQSFLQQEGDNPTMHCRACDVMLTDEESKRKSRVTGEYLDMCNTCLGTIIGDIPESIDEEDGLWDTAWTLEDLDE